MKRFVFALLLVAACASPERKAADAQKSAESWAAAAKMTAEEWRRGAVTDGYVRSTARVAIEELSRNAGVPPAGQAASRRQEALRLWRELQDKVQ